MDMDDQAPAVSPGQRWRRYGRVGLGLAVSLLCLWLALRDIAFDAVLVSLRQAQLTWVALALLSVLVTNLAKAARWRLLFYPHHRHLPIHSLFAILLSGQAVTLAMPVRGGELVRAYLVGARFGDSKAQTLATVGVEKMLDLALLALCVLALSPFLVASNAAGAAALTSRRTTMILAALVLLAGAIIGLHWRQQWMSLARRALDRLPNNRGGRWIGWLDAALRGLDAFRYPTVVIRVVLWSLVIWLLAGSTNYLTLLALRLPGDWVVSFTLLAILQAGISVPSSPGKIGVFQYLCQLTLTWFGMAAVHGFAVGVLLYVVAPLALMIGGGLALLWQTWQLRRDAPSAIVRDLRAGERRQSEEARP